MTQERLNELVAWAEKRTKCVEYAKSIVKAEKEARDAHKILSDNSEVWSPDEWLDFYTKVERMERSVTMKIKHFFTMVYGKENPFCEGLKGKDSVDHWFTFYNFAHKDYCNCEI